jgi:molecular chaperone GrpE
MGIVEEKEKDMVTPEEEAEKFVSGQEGSENETVEESGKTAEDGGQAGCRETGEKAESEPGGTESDGPEETKKEKETAGQEKAGRDKEKKVFGRKNKEDKKTEALNEKIGELEDKVKRQLAEFENFRHRTEKEKTAMFEVGAKSVIEKILPVVDNFERGLSGLSEEEKEAPFASGMQMVYKQLLTELDNLGVKPIEAVGKEFDPNLHNAVMQVESEEYESGIVAQEMMKGYLYRDSVVRHSMVAVVS